MNRYPIGSWFARVCAAATCMLFVLLGSAQAAEPAVTVVVPVAAPPMIPTAAPVMLPLLMMAAPLAALTPAPPVPDLPLLPPLAPP